MTPIEPNHKKFRIIVDSLGYVGAVRFLKQFDNGQGDYTHEQGQWLDDLTLEEIWANLQKNPNA
jgi:hypothetical protein